MLVPAIRVTAQFGKAPRSESPSPAAAAAADVISPGATTSGLNRPSSVGPNELNDAMWSTRLGDRRAGWKVTTRGIAASSLRRDDAGTEAAAEFYSKFVSGRILQTTARTAEMAKLVENSFRDVNIAFANELSVLCEDCLLYTSPSPRDRG